MFKFSQRSLDNLNECHPDLQLIAHEAIKYFDFVVYEGYRGKEDQDKYFFEGKSKVRFPNSKHNKSPSMAFDAAPYPINWDRTGAFYFMAGIMIAVAKRLKDEGKISHNLRWGGDFNRDRNLYNDKFIDLPHFELE